MPLIEHVLRHAGRPGDREIAAKWRKLADKAEPGLRDPNHPGYAAARQLTDKFDQPDTPADEHTPEMVAADKKILQAIRHAVSTDSAADDLAVIRTHSVQLAKAHGIVIPAKLRASIQERQPGKRPDPAKLSEMLKKGGKVNVGDEDDETDEVGVRLTKGEYVIDKNSTDQFEPLLKKINEWGGRGPRSQGGMGVGPSGAPRSTGRGGRAGGFHVTGRPRDERR